MKISILINKKCTLSVDVLCYFTVHLNLHCPNVHKFCTMVELETFAVFRVHH